MSESWFEYAVELTGDAAYRHLAQRGHAGVLALWAAKPSPVHIMVGDDRMCPTAAPEQARIRAGELGGTVARRRVQAGEWETHPS